MLHKLGENDFLIVINAGTREKDVAWVRSVIGAMPGVHVMDVSDYYTQLAIQGPRAKETLQQLTRTDLSDQELLVYVGRGGGLPQCADCAHRLHG